MVSSKTVTTRVPEPLVDEVEAKAEEEHRSRSEMTKLLVETGLEHYDEEDTAGGRAVSPLALLGVVSLAIAPTLLATGHTLVGGAAGVVVAVYALLWVTATDHLLEEWLGTARDELRAVGGVRGFFRAVIYEDRVVEEPETLVERLTRADIVGAGLLTVFTVLALPLALAARVGLLAPALEAIGSLGVLALLVGAVVLAYGGALLLGISAIATLAVASARHDLAADDPADA
jgi:hypothetical protein